MFDNRDLELYRDVMRIEANNITGFVAGFNYALDDVLEEEPSLTNLLQAAMEQIRLAKQVGDTNEEYTAITRDGQTIEILPEQAYELHKSGVFIAIAILARLWPETNVELSEQEQSIVINWQESSEEPIVEEPIVEEPATEEPIVEEPTIIEEPAIEEPTKNKSWKFQGW